ncbi:MAG: glycosyltransferase [Holophagae bacterium]|jgi:glycosyltransferase involved in cell wall biosynthesis/4-amino-4-deoxy-L-arabinose transferase-like glycosyltransferase
MVLGLAWNDSQPCSRRVSITTDSNADRDQNNAVDLSVVIPVYNAEDFIEQSLGELFSVLAASECTAELVVVDDGSCDRTAAVVERTLAAAPVAATLLRQGENRGKGAAVACGMARASGARRVFIDADLPFPPQAILEAYDNLGNGADVVVASRVHDDSKYLVRPSFFRYLYTRHLAGRFFNLLVRVLLLPGIRDSQAGLKAFSAKAAEALFSGWLPSGFSFDLALLARARRLGLSIAQIPVLFRYDSEPTTIRFLADTSIMIRDLVAVRLRIGGPSIAESSDELTGWSRRRWRRTSLFMSRPVGRSIGIFICLAVLSGLVITRLWLPHAGLAIAAWIVAMASFVLLVHGADAGAETTRRDLFASRGERWSFWAIVAVAAFLRLWHLDQSPPMIHGDSAECGIQGLHILKGLVPDIFDFSQWYTTPYLAYMPYAASFAIFGLTVLGLRLPSAILGILCVIPLYFLVRGWFGPRVARIACGLFAFSHSAVHFSRIGLWNVQTLFVELTSFALLFAAIRQRRALPAALAGLAAGFALYSYTAGRLIIVVIAAFLAIRFLVERRRRPVELFAVFATGAVVAAAPLILNYVKNPNIIRTDRTGGVFVLAESNLEHVYFDTGEISTAEVLWLQTKKTLGGFVSLGDASGQYGTRQPLLSSATAALAVAGLLILLCGIRRPDSQFLLLWAVLGLVLSSILVMDPPFHPRLVVLFPVPYILAGVALERLLRPLLEAGGAIRAAAVLLILAAITQSAYFDLTGYRDYLRTIDAETTEWDIIEVLGRVGTEHDYYLFGGPMITVPLPGLRLFAEKRRLVIGFTPRDVPHDLQRDTVFVAVPTVVREHAPLQTLGQLIGSRFPLTHREVTYRQNEPQLVLYFASPIGGTTERTGGGGETTNAQ